MAPQKKHKRTPADALTAASASAALSAELTAGVSAEAGLDTTTAAGPVPCRRGEAGERKPRALKGGGVASCAVCLRSTLLPLRSPRSSGGRTSRTRAAFSFARSADVAVALPLLVGRGAAVAFAPARSARLRERRRAASGAAGTGGEGRTEMTATRLTLCGSKGPFRKEKELCQPGKGERTEHLNLSTTPQSCRARTSE